MKTAKCPESLCPVSALPLLEDVSSIPARTLLPAHRSYGLIRQSHLPLLAFGYWPRTRSLRRLLPAPAANGIFRVEEPRFAVGVLWLCPPFPASCPFRGSITPSPAPATSNRTGGFPASRLTAEASSIGVMGPFSWGMLSRSSTPRGSLERGPTFRTPPRYSTASSRIPCACTSWPPVASPCGRPRT